MEPWVIGGICWFFGFCFNLVLYVCFWLTGAHEKFIRIK